MGFDFTVIAPLLPSHCGFSVVFGCGVSFLVSSSVFLSMIVQQLVVILVFSQGGVRACPSTPPSWFLLHPSHFLRSSSNALFSKIILFPFILISVFFERLYKILYISYSVFYSSLVFTSLFNLQLGYRIFKRDR